MTKFDVIKEVRTRTGLGLAEVTKAVNAAGEDVELALQWLRANGPKAKIEDPVDPAAEGRIATYVHHNHNMAAMVHLACKTDFTARNAEFIQLANDIAMHVAAANPRWVSIASIPAEVLASERMILTRRTIDEGVPEARREQVITGRLRGFYCETVLTEQPFTKDTKTTVGKMIEALSAKTGEPITVKAMARFEVGR